MMVLAPGRLSMMTGWPQVSVIFCPIRRDTRSLGPPAGNGTTIWIGRLGKDDASCSYATAAALASINIVIASEAKRSRTRGVADAILIIAAAAARCRRPSPA